MKLFISYSHKNKGERETLDKHLAILRKNDNLTVWSDIEILPGKDLENEVDENVNTADIICLLLSADYFSSDPCLKECQIALQKKIKGEASVIPVILSHCGWKDTELSKIKALPNDGKEISTYRNQNEAWFEVYEGIKKIIQDRYKRNDGHVIVGELPIRESFRKELEATELSAVLTMNLGLTDFFVGPDFKKIEFDEKETKISFDDLIKSYLKAPNNIVISGDRQSGKTAVLKKFFYLLQSSSLPIFLDCTDNLPGKFSNIIEKAFKSQYSTSVKYCDVPLTRILLLDNFHKLKIHKRKEIIQEIKSLLNFRMIVVVDDIFDLGIREHLQENFLEHYQIKEMGFKLVDQLVCRWMELQNKDFENETIYRDELNAKINSIVEKTIVPAYPFFLYTIIGANSISSTLNPEITSRGHCYQALIYIALRRIGVKDLQIDMYINFLSEFSNFLFKNKSKEASTELFKSFIDEYCEQYTVSGESKALIGNLLKACLLKESIGGYSFKYPYIYYYFFGKYLADHLEDSQKIIESAVDNLHDEENGYIVIFLTHHTKDIKILDRIKINLLCLFDKQEEAGLLNSEITHLEKYFEKLMPVFVDKFNDIEKNRAKVLEEKDNVASSAKSIEKENGVNDVFMAELRKAIKTVEVAGHILKNRFGSLKKDQQREILEIAMSVYFRVTKFLLTELQGNENDFIEQLSYLVAKKIEKQEEREGKKSGDVPDRKEIRDIAARIYFEFNFMVCYATIKRCAFAFGSRDLLGVFQDVCEQKNTPLSMLVKRQALAMYRNSLNPEEIKKECSNISPMVKRLLIAVVLDHFYMHKIRYDDRQRMSAILGINDKKLQIEMEKK